MANRTTIYRATKNPEKAVAKNLYELAARELTSMEALMHVPLFLLGREIEGIVQYNDYYYAYTSRIPAIAPADALFVYAVDTDIVVSKERRLKKDEVCIGIVTLKIEKTPISGTVERKF